MQTASVGQTASLRRLGKPPRRQGKRPVPPRVALAKDWPQSADVLSQEYCVIKLCVLLVAFVASSGAQTKVSLPAWLSPYPGAHVESSKATETSYTVAAKPDDVIAHYRKLLVSQALPFIPNFDGMGTSVRAAAAECDLLLKIRESDSGTSIRVSCTPRIAGSNSSLYGADVGIVNPAPAPPPDDKATSDADPKKAAPPEPPKKDIPTGVNTKS